MDNIQEGFVVENDGTFAKIKVFIHSNCENCGACASTDVFISAQNHIGAKIGQKIKFIAPQNNTIKIAFILFFMPLLSVFTGVYAGKIIADKFHFNQVISMAMAGILFFLMSVAFIVFYDRKTKRNNKSIARIIEIIP